MTTPDTFKIGKRTLGPNEPTYFVADISANHDGELDRAIQLIHLAAEAGADAAKFQNFQAPKIVSKLGFDRMGSQQGHQSKWKKSVFQVYKEASIPWEWTPILKAECDKVGIDYFSTPYDFGAVDMLDPYVSLYKIGSGDITWLEILEKIAEKKKPILIATGASDIADVNRAMNFLESFQVPLVLMQCNTNYTGSLENFRHIHLNTLKTFGLLYPKALLGLSDHTPGHATVLGSIALGARVIEKHFTDDPKREGPDHPFSMSPTTWREMVDRTRELELSLGSTQKFICPNEIETVVVQRRCIRAAINLTKGSILRREMLEVVRPAPHTSIPPYDISKLIGMRLREDIEGGEHLQWHHLEPAL